MKRIRNLTHEGKRHIPLPTGPYTVGCMDIMTSYLKFGVFVRLYYPSEDNGILDRHLQWPMWTPHKQYINGYAGRIGMPASIYRFLHKYLVGELYIPAVWQAPLKQFEEKLPVVIFSHGLSGWRTTYSAQCLELASYGLMVVAMEHRDYSASASFYKKQSRMSSIGKNPGSSLCIYDELLSTPITFKASEILDGKKYLGPSSQEIGPYSHANEWIFYQPATKENEATLRNQQVKYRAKECIGALNLIEDLNKGFNIGNVLDANFDSKIFQNKLDMKNVYFIGHSFGGATGFVTLATDQRFKAGILLDPWMFPFYDNEDCFSKISAPFLCLLVKSFQTKKCFEVLKHLQDIHKGGRFILMKNADHRDLCDTPFVPKFSLSLSSKVGLKIERFSALDLATDLILQYLSEHLGKLFRETDPQIEHLKTNYLDMKNCL